ncbi:MAG: hypothetical protein HGA36_01535 [Candidatus Moranbacteria bacterium]|nr:hypothetical protein [Candidatus Moranbacteria bacterium]
MNKVKMKKIAKQEFDSVKKKLFSLGIISILVFLLCANMSSAAVNSATYDSAIKSFAGVPSPTYETMSWVSSDGRQGDLLAGVNLIISGLSPTTMTPYGVAVDSINNLYVVDYGNNRILKRSEDGTTWTNITISGLALNSFNSPFAVATDSVDNLYVSDSGNNRILKRSADGTTWTEITISGLTPSTFSNPNGTALDSIGNLYVSDSGNNRILKRSADGTTWTDIVISGLTPSTFSNPRDVKIDSSGVLYVADTTNNRILRRSADGTTWTNITISGLTPSTFNLPYRVTVDSSDNLYVSDLNNNRILKRSADGATWTKITITELTPGTFSQPVGLAIDRKGALYVGDYGNGRVIKLYSGTSITMRVRTGNATMSNAAAWSSSCDVASSGANIGIENPCVRSGDQYVQYQAILSTDVGINTPSLSSVTIATQTTYAQSFLNLISSPFNTGNANNSVQKITWSASNDAGSDPAQGTVQFQLRTSPDNVTWGQWCGPTACDAAPGGGVSDFYTDKAGATAINVAQKDSNGDQWIQYATFLKSNDGTTTPTLSNVTMQYAYNVPPAITIDSNPANLKQTSTGTFQVPYTLSETYDDLGVIAHGTAAAPIKALLFYQPKNDVTLNGATPSGQSTTAVTKIWGVGGTDGNTAAGNYTFTVPAGVTNIRDIELAGGGGGSGACVSSVLGGDGGASTLTYASLSRGVASGGTGSGYDGSVDACTTGNDSTATNIIGGVNTAGAGANGSTLGGGKGGLISGGSLAVTPGSQVNLIVGAGGIAATGGTAGNMGWIKITYDVTSEGAQTTGLVSINNPSNVPIPSTGSMLIDNELMTFDSVGATGNQRNITGRAATFATSYSTTAVSHTTSSPIFFATSASIQTIDTLIETDTPGAQATINNTFIWDPRADATNNLSGNKLDGALFKVVANDADASNFNTIGQSATTGAQTIDLQAPTITSITTDEAHTATGANILYLNKNSAQIPLTVNFSENISFDATGGKTITLTLNSGTCTIAESILNSNVATCQYAIGADEETPVGEKLKLAAPFVAASTAITDGFANTLTNFTPAANLDAATNIVIDNIAPTANDLTDIITKDQFTSANLNAQDSDGSGIASYAWSKVSGPGTITFGSSTASETTISANTDGPYVLQVVITDNSGNAITKTLNLIWDTTNPANISKPNVPSLTNDNTPNITWDQFTDANGLEKYEVQRKTDTVGDNFATIQTITDTATLETANPTFTESTLADDTYFYQIIATDKAGNVQTSPASDAMTVDTIAPTLLYFYSTSPDSTVLDPTASGNINLVAVYDEAVNTGNVQVRVGPMSATVNVTLDQVLETTKLQGSFTIGAPRTGYDTTPDPLKIEQILAQSVSDQAGNVQAQTLATIEDNMNLVARGNSIIIDTTPPILNSFTIENNSVTAFKQQNNAFTLVANYNKTIQAGGNLKVKLNTGSSSPEITLTNSAAGKKLTASYSVQADENANDLKVEAVLEQNVLDGKGAPANYIGNILDGTYAANAGDPVINLAGFQVDTAAPTLGATPIAIQNSNGKTSDSTPTITLSATDNFNLSKAIFSLNSGTAWCAPISYGTAINTFDITSIACGGSATNGIKTVTVKFVDAAGNESAASAASVEFDDSKPQLQTITTDTITGIYGPGTVIKIIATYDEAITSGSLSLILNNGKQLNLSTIENGNTLTATYTVGDLLEDTNKLKVATIVSQSVADTSEPVNTQDSTSLAGITENLDTNKTVEIDTTAPAATVTVDRSKDNNQIHLDATDKNSANMQAEILVLESETGTCSFTNNWISYADNVDTTLIENTASSRKVCARFKDELGNVSNEIAVIIPETPSGVQIDDISNSEIPFYGSMLTWSIPTIKGTNNGSGDAFAQYEIAKCGPSESEECTPDFAQFTSITDISRNYFVSDNLTAEKFYCYQMRFKDMHGDYSKLSKNTCFQAGHAPAVTDSQVSIISGNPDDIQIGNVTEQGATVFFQTKDSKYNRPIATKAQIEVFTSPTLSADTLVATTPIESEFAVVHTIHLSGLTSGTQYYLKITATDSSTADNEGRTGVLAYSADGIPTLSFSTLGTLKTISNIDESIVTDSKAVITFVTDQDAKCYIDFKDSLSATYNDLSDSLEKDFYKNHSITLTQLLSKTAYDYKISCIDKNDVTVTADEHHFTTTEKGLTQGDVDAQSDNTAPVISSISLDKVTGESATITWNTDEAANSLILYEVEGSDFTIVAGDAIVISDIKEYATTHSVAINNLIPATKYTFISMSTDTGGNIAQSSQSSFTTKQPSGLSSVKVVSKALGQATVTWTTGQAVSSLVEYGLTTGYGDKKESNTKVKEHEITITDLKAGEEYHLRVKGTSDAGELFASSDITFQPKAPPKISDFKIDEITEHGATVKFNTNVPTDSLITYTDADKEENSGFQGKPEVATKHEMQLKNMESGRTYGIKLKVRDEEGNETEETFQNFTTTKDEKPPVIDRVKTDAALTQTDKVQAIISWTTDEMSTGEVIYKEGKTGDEKKFEVNSSPSFSHIGVITSFKAGVVYYFKVKSIDQAGNVANSTDYAVLTPKKRQNIIQVIIGNFTDIFGWAKF